MQKIIRIFFIFIAIILMGYLYFINLVPFGKIKKISTYDLISQITLGPMDRVLKLEESYLQISDLIYMTTYMDSKFDLAKVRMTFKNTSEEQTIHLGFQNSEKWSYDTQLVEAPLLEDLVSGFSWYKTNNKPTIYQKQKEFSDFKDFTSNVAQDKIIGFYNFDSNILKTNYISGYTPKKIWTYIDTPLRGRIVFYTYIDKQLFQLKFWKQDLNLYEDPDRVNVKIYKDKDVVFSTVIEDDGITDGSGKISSPVEAYIQNPGPGLPEPGVYRVVIEGTSNTVISKIATNMHKIVFESPLFPISNAEVYKRLIEQTYANTIYTDALILSATTYHKPAEQDIKFGEETLKMESQKETVATTSAATLTKVEIPKSDVVLKGLLGYFAFSEDQYFKPSPYKLLPITSKEDINLVDYVITDYTPSRQEGEWRVAEAVFDLKTAYIKKDKLSWIIKAPGLKENNRNILIKNIEVELTKKPLIKL